MNARLLKTLTRSLAFLTRSIRQDSRTLSHHVMRAAMPAIILLLFFFKIQTYALKGSSGGGFANQIFTCCYWFLTLVGGMHFSTALTEEKEEQTLALLRMTGAKPYSILLGKSLPRLATSVLFILVIAPFLILSITLGGVLPLGLVAAILNLLCYAVMLSQIGLLASVLARTAKAAFTMASIAWIAIELSDWWYSLANIYVQAWVSSGLLQRDGIVAWIMYDLLGSLPEYSLCANMNQTLLAFDTLGSDPNATILQRLESLGHTLLHPRMAFQLCTAVVCFLLSWLLFGPCTTHQESTGPSKTLSWRPRRQVGRVWSNALAWKSWQYAGGGSLWIWIRSAGGTLGIVGFAIALLAGIGGLDEPIAIAGISLALGAIFFVLNVFRLFGGVLSTEVQEKTLPALVMLPQRTSATLRNLVAGVLPGVLASSCCLLISIAATTLFAVAEGAELDEIFTALMQPWLWHFLSMVILTIHLGLLLTTYVRYGGMVLAAVLMWIVAPMLCSMSFMLVAFASGPSGFVEELMQYIVPVIMIVGELGLCYFIQRAIVDRVEVLASQ